MATKVRGPKLLTTGPWKGVFDSNDPFDDTDGLLVDAVNMYLPDPVNGSGIYQRPGFSQLNTDVLGVSPYRAAGIYTHRDLAGTAFHFVAISGKLYRADTTLSVFTDVTPVGVALDATVGTRIYFASLNGVMVVNDGVHRPWVASNLTATPITGTYISIDGAATAWVAFGQPVVYGGAGFFVLRSVGATNASSTLAWSEPGDWTTGYQQAGFDNTWSLEQTGTTPIYSLAATNAALYYFRERSIGTISGTVGPDLAANATHDAISYNVGNTAPATVQQFGDNIFFCDAIGRPYLLRQGNAPVDIWKQMRAVVDSAQSGFPAITQFTACAAIDPILNKYIVGIWSESPASQSPTAELYNFDARSGVYEGRWLLAGDSSSQTGIQVDAMGVWTDEVGRSVLVMLAEGVGFPSGYLYGMNALTQIGQVLAEEDTTDWIGEEDGTTALATEGVAVTWLDASVTNWLMVETQRMGYSATQIQTVDRVSIITQSASSVRVRVTTPTSANVYQGAPTPPTSSDGTYRLIGGCEGIQGRGVSVQLEPVWLATDEPQWILQQIVVQAVPSLAGVDEP